VDGNWLVLGDKSGSMSACIEVARHVSGTLAKFVKAKFHLVFFDTTPRHFDVTGKTYEEIQGADQDGRCQRRNFDRIVAYLWRWTRSSKWTECGRDGCGREHSAVLRGPVTSGYARCWARTFPVYLYLVGATNYDTVLTVTCALR